MDYRIFRAINQFAGRYRLLDVMVITFSQKVRYLFVNNLHVVSQQLTQKNHFICNHFGWSIDDCK
jgi:hypothetical protein